MAEGEIYHVVCQISVSGRFTSFGLHYIETTDNQLPNRADVFASEYATAYETLIQNCIGAEAQIQAFYVRIVQPAFQIPGLSNRDDVFGQAGPECIPANSAMLFSIQSDDPQLERSGRIYIAGISKDALDNGNLSGAFQSGPQEALRAALQAGFTGSTINATLGILRKVNNGTPLDPPLFIPADRVARSGIIYSQRRRTTKLRGVTG